MFEKRGLLSNNGEIFLEPIEFVIAMNRMHNDKDYLCVLPLYFMIFLPSSL